MRILRGSHPKINRNSLRQLAVFSRTCPKRLLIEISYFLSSTFSGKMPNLNTFIYLIFLLLFSGVDFVFVPKKLNLNLDPCGL